jgi:hypothetical protein
VNIAQLENGEEQDATYAALVCRLRRTCYTLISYIMLAT